MGKASAVLLLCATAHSRSVNVYVSLFNSLTSIVLCSLYQA